MMLAGELNRAMIVGKGSLFLGRLTNLFDGVSFVLDANANEAVVDKKIIKVGLTLLGSEHGEEEIRRGAALAENPNIKVVLIEAANEKAAHNKMEEMLANNEIQAAVTMHYNFPIGISTVGRAITPARGRQTWIASTTGTSDTQRGAALLKNTVTAIAVAKACGNPRPTVGILNIEGANTLARQLQTLRENGYDIQFTESARADGGVVMRGNDLLQGTPDIMVMDSLTGNVIMKMLSAFSTGGSYEAAGDGYGPGAGENMDKIINIISRTSGAPVVAGAIAYAAACAKGNLIQRVTNEFAAARKAGLNALLEKAGVNAAARVQPAGDNSSAARIQPPGDISGDRPGAQRVRLSEELSPGGVRTQSPEELSPDGVPSTEITAPPEKIVTAEIPGIEILSLEDAVQVLWKHQIYAASGMGCTGPVVMVAPEDEETARALLKDEGYL
jgi:hypothetical protein